MLKVCKLYLVFTAPFTEIDNIPETVDGSRDDCLATVVWMAYWYSSFNSKKTFIFFCKECSIHCMIYYRLTTKWRNAWCSIIKLDTSSCFVWITIRQHSYRNTMAIVTATRITISLFLSIQKKCCIIFTFHCSICKRIILSLYL